MLLLNTLMKTPSYGNAAAEECTSQQLRERANPFFINRSLQHDDEARGMGWRCCCQVGSCWWDGTDLTYDNEKDDWDVWKIDLVSCIGVPSKLSLLSLLLFLTQFANLRAYCPLSTQSYCFLSSSMLFSTFRRSLLRPARIRPCPSCRRPLLPQAGWNRPGSSSAAKMEVLRARV